LQTTLVPWRVFYCLFPKPDKIKETQTMGGLFSAPKPPPLPPVASIPDPAEEEKKRRLEALERRRRGRQGTIATSARGLLALADNTPRRKSLLGE
jgi:hypothetical protein